MKLVNKTSNYISYICMSNKNQHFSKKERKFRIHLLSYTWISKTKNAVEVPNKRNT
jgi:hypothetical protein